MKNIKYFILLAGLILLTASCSKENLLTVKNTEEATAHVTVHVDNFSIEQEEYPGTRATSDMTSFARVKVITLAFYRSDGTEEYKMTQLRGDDSSYDTFGEFSLALPIGSYTMVVLGYGGTAPIILNSTTEAIYPTDEHVRETFVATQDVNITSSEDVELGASLNRVSSALFVVSTDNKSDNATNLRMTFSAGGRGLNPQTGLATSNTGFNNTTILNNFVDGLKTGSTSYLFLVSDEQTMTVTLDVLNAEGKSISHREINNVPFKRNRRTKLTGSVYSTSVSAVFTIEDEPLDDYEMSF